MAALKAERLRSREDQPWCRKRERLVEGGERQSKSLCKEQRPLREGEEMDYAIMC